MHLTDDQWAALPKGMYPSKTTCHNRFQEWVDHAVFQKILTALYKVCGDQGFVDLREAFIDGTFSAAKNGGVDVGPTKKGKGTKIMVMVDASGIPLAVHTSSASPAEVILVHDTVDASFGLDYPKRLIGDKAYDSDSLDEELRHLGIDMIAPNRRRRKKTQDGRKLRRYKRRWKVERTIAWLQSFRRVRVRDEFKAKNFLAMVQLACIIILLRLISG